MWCLGYCNRVCISVMFFFQAEDGIRDLVRSRGLGDVYKRQVQGHAHAPGGSSAPSRVEEEGIGLVGVQLAHAPTLSLIHI